jgi:glycosyltransferase involved in cell wall biosynthesis
LAIAHGSDVALLRRLPGGAAMVRSLARRADLVYVGDALRIPGAPGRVVSMPPAAEMLPRSEAERRAARAALGLAPPGEGPLVLLFCGRMVPDKGADLLAAALPEGAIALLVGDGPMRPAPGARLRWLGPRFGAELRRCQAAADLLVVPSRCDAAPTVIQEARAVGLPVLATRVGAIPELVGHGLLVEPEPSALRQAIAILVASRQLPAAGPPAPSWAQVGPRLWGSVTHEGPASNRKQSVVFY